VGGPARRKFEKEDKEKLLEEFNYEHYYKAK